jgi:hypothetical protein
VTPAGRSRVFHLELRQFPHVARVFNLEREELDSRFVMPWASGALIEHDDRRWAPERARLTVLSGPPLGPGQLGLGRGWATATRQGRDVTEEVVTEARRGAAARPEVEALKLAVDEVLASGAGGLEPADVVALAAAAHPTWRASQHLELAEQAVWEMLHQRRAELSAGPSPVAAENWQTIIMAWPTWSRSGRGAASIRLTRRRDRR